MPLAVLTIDLEARLAGLQEGFDKAAHLANKNAREMEAAWNRAGARIASIGTMVVSAFAGVSFVGMLRSQIDALDALNDVADATGSSMENLSALEDIARRTGTTMDTVTAAVIKLNSQLSDGKPDSPVAKALNGIGLEVNALKALDPAEALHQVAVALAGYADDGNKARLVQDLFGKSVREVAPLLKDLAEQQRLVATVTAEQAEQAEKLNKQLAQFETQAALAGRRIATELLPAMNKALESYAKFGLLKGIVLPALGLDDYSKQARDLELLQENVQRAADRVDRLAGALSRSPSDNFMASHPGSR